MTTNASIEWNTAAAAHLLRRAGFGGTPEDAAALGAMGMEAAVEKLLQPPDDGGPAPPTAEADERAVRQQRRAAQRNGQEANLRDFQRRQQEIFRQMQFWWLQRMADPAHAASEKLTLFWHSHFATSQAKVRFNHAMLAQNQTLRRQGAGPFPELCEAMAKDPAMLLWLDGNQNTAKAPNENFAREIMELFTLGEGHYRETDIHEAARAFTGWVVPPQTGQARFVPRRFDAGEKTMFGQTGNFDAAGTVRLLCEQSPCAEFLSGKLWMFYAGSPPSPGLTRDLASRYRSTKLDTGKLLRTIFTHPEFYAKKTRASQIKSPVQWLVQASHELHRQLLPPGLSLPLTAALGQNLFVPPSVKGWDGGTAWINSATLIRRSNTARIFTVAAPPLPENIPGSLDALAWSRVAPPETRTSASLLRQRLENVFLATPLTSATRKRLDAALENQGFPYSDDTVREAAIALMDSPEYNLC